MAERQNFVNKHLTNKTPSIMRQSTSSIRPSLEDIVALFARGREIKERRMREARQKWETRQRQKEAAAKSGYYDLEWTPQG